MSHLSTATPKTVKTNRSPVFSFLIAFVWPSNIVKQLLALESHRDALPKAKTFCSGSYILPALARVMVDVVLPAGTTAMAQAILPLVKAVPPLLMTFIDHRRPVIVPGKVAAG